MCIKQEERLWRVSLREVSEYGRFQPCWVFDFHCFVCRIQCHSGLFSLFTYLYYWESGSEFLFFLFDGQGDLKFSTKMLSLQQKPSNAEMFWFWNAATPPYRSCSSNGSFCHSLRVECCQGTISPMMDHGVPSWWRRRYIEGFGLEASWEI